MPTASVVTLFTKRPVRRILASATTLAGLYSLVGYAEGMPIVEALLACVAAFALLAGVGCLLHRRDLVALVRTRRGIGVTTESGSRTRLKAL